MHHQEVAQVLPVLASGGLILYPTDTIWGIGCSANDVAAIERIFTLKNRPKEKGFVLLVSDMDMLDKYIERIHPKLNSLNQYHERPVTVIYKNPRNLPSILIADDNSVAIRIVKDDFCSALIKAFGQPLIATSANISGEPFPKYFEEITDDVKKGVDYIVKHRQTETKQNAPSVIVTLSKKNELIFLRN